MYEEQSCHIKGEVIIYDLIRCLYIVVENSLVQLKMQQNIKQLRQVELLENKLLRTIWLHFLSHHTNKLHILLY